MGTTHQRETRGSALMIRRIGNEMLSRFPVGIGSIQGTSAISIITTTDVKLLIIMLFDFSQSFFFSSHERMEFLQGNARIRGTNFSLSNYHFSSFLFYRSFIYFSFHISSLEEVKIFRHFLSTKHVQSSFRLNGNRTSTTSESSRLCSDLNVM